MSRFSSKKFFLRWWEILFPSFFLFFFFFFITISMFFGSHRFSLMSRCLRHPLKVIKVECRHSAGGSFFLRWWKIFFPLFRNYDIGTLRWFPSAMIRFQLNNAFSQGGGIFCFLSFWIVISLFFNGYRYSLMTVCCDILWWLLKCNERFNSNKFSLDVLRNFVFFI